MDPEAIGELITKRLASILIDFSGALPRADPAP
jgi:hypothetical protein